VIPEAQELTVTLNLQPMAFKDIDPAQRAAWVSFWSELIQRVLQERSRPQPGRAKGGENQHHGNGVVSKEDNNNGNAPSKSMSSN
jgi:hypothetical protein